MILSITKAFDLAGIKAVLEANPNLKGEVIVFGTPAEEGGGGKIKMIHKGSFDECDICMMVHPAPMDMIAPICLSICQIGIIFTGRYITCVFAI